MNKFLHVAALGAAALISANSALALTIFRETFNDPPNAAGMNVTPAGWQLVTGTVDVVNASFNIVCGGPSGANCLDINGSSNQAGVIRNAAPIALFAGNSYDFAFWVSGSQRTFGGANPNNSNTLTYRVYDATTNTTITSGTVTREFNAPWEQVKVLNLAGQNLSNVRIEFNGGNDTDNVGLLIDDIVLECGGNTCTGNGVPEPASLALVGIGLMLVSLRRR